jgi:hypothetical protein
MRQDVGVCELKDYPASPFRLDGGPAPPALAVDDARNKLKLCDSIIAQFEAA